MDIVNEQVEAYLRSLLDRYDEPVLVEMEREGHERGFPIIDRTCGVEVELLTRAIGARRVFELGSGFGYSAYWFARAVGPGGEVHGTDGDPANEPKAMEYLGRAGLADRIRWHVGDAVTSFGAVDGEFDVVYCDVDKTGYPDAWRAARERIRIGGLYLCDNTLGTGSGTILDDGAGFDAIREHNAMIAADERYVSSIIPTREGVLMALRVG
jgi:predicted O-methyltransferase YrrM